MEFVVFPIFVDHGKRLASKDRGTLYERGCDNVHKVQLGHYVTEKYYRKYVGLANQLGIRITNLGLFVSSKDPETALFKVYAAYCDDKHFNSIPLSIFDGLGQSFIALNRGRNGSVSLAEIVCVYKLLLTFQVLGAKPIFVQQEK